MPVYIQRGIPEKLQKVGSNMVFSNMTEEGFAKSYSKPCTDEKNNLASFEGIENRSIIDNNEIAQNKTLSCGLSVNVSHEVSHNAGYNISFGSLNVSPTGSFHGFQRLPYGPNALPYSYPYGPPPTPVDYSWMFQKYRQNQIPFIPMHPLQNKFINDTMKNIREAEMDRIRSAKRRKVLFLGRNEGGRDLEQSEDRNAIENNRKTEMQNEAPQNETLIDGIEHRYVKKIEFNDWGQNQVATPVQEKERIKSDNDSVKNTYYAPVEVPPDYNASGHHLDKSSNKGNTSNNVKEYGKHQGHARAKASNILEVLSRHTDVAQIVATAGGLITYRNQAYAKIMSAASSSVPPKSAPPSSQRNESTNETNLKKPQVKPPKQPLTIFELIEPHSLPNLYGMLALALHDVGIVEVEHIVDTASSGVDSDSGVASNSKANVRCEGTSLNAAETGPEISASVKPSSRASRMTSEILKSSHLAITLPCKSFGSSSSAHYNVTIIFMDDQYLSPIKRCFLGVLTSSVPSTSSKEHLRGNKDSVVRIHSSPYLSSPCIHKISRSPSSDISDKEEEHCENSDSKKRKRNEGPFRPAPAAADAASASAIAEAVRARMPHGKIFRVEDELLCRMLILGST